MASVETASSNFWNRSHYLDRMNFRDLVVAYFQHYTIISYPVLTAAAETKGIVTAEEHRITGGLGGAVAELLAREYPTAMRMVGMPDEFGVVGPTGKVREGYGLSCSNIVQSCRELIA